MKTVIEMALESKVAFDSEEYPEIWQTYMDVGRKELERFAEMVRAQENEACALIADEAEPYNAADLIRKRMKK
jgi:hypothetical protein